MQIRQADKHMRTSLRGIARRAKEDPKHRFGNLYSLLNEKNLLECFPAMNRKASPYLHYALDLWFEKVVKPLCKGDVMLMRFADDFVCCFQHREDERRVSRVLGKRLGKFALELSSEKTQVIKFTRFETENSESFTFLGFEFRWGKSRKGKPLVKMQTAKKKFQLALAALTGWIKKDRSRLGTAALMIKLGQKLQGHFNYYGVSGKAEKLKRFYQQSRRIVFKWLNRRTQKKSCNWIGFGEMLKLFHSAPAKDNRLLVITLALVRSEQY